jgi:hypothetical protein
MEIGKITPPLTDRNASAAIAFVSRCLRVGAALHHAAPDFLKRVFVESMSTHGFLVETAAGSRHTAPQRLTKDRSFIAAITTTKPPSGTILGIFTSAKDSQATKSLTYQVIRLPADASAGPGVSSHEISHKNLSFGATRAATFVNGRTGRHPNELDNRPSSKRSTGDIFSRGHDDLPERLSGQVAEGCFLHSSAAHFNTKET